MNYKLQDLIDIQQFQYLQDRLNEIYSFPSAIIDNDGNILTATAWQDICTQFHRKNKDCQRDCIQSDQYILSHLHEANPAVSYRCPRGLVDNATPIIIGGVHYGNFFTGQFFLEKPDLEIFRAQAKKFGFDETTYLEAVKKVPVWSQKQLESYLFFIKGLIVIISESGLKKLKEIESGKQVEESEERYRAILQTVMDGFWLVDMQGRLIEVNETYCKMSGYSAQELLSMRIPDLESAESAGDTASHIQKIMLQGEDRFESRHRRKDGQIYDVEVSAQYRPAGGGRFVAFLRDITGRKRVEEALRESEERFRLLFQSMESGFALHEIICDAQGVPCDYRFLEINPAFEKLTELKAQSLIGHTVMEMLPGTEKEWVERYGKVALTGESASFENFFRELGKYYHVTAYSPRHGQFAVIFQDITEVRRAEEEKQHLHEQLLQAQKMESVGRLAGGVAHDFNNLLGVIIGRAETALAKVYPHQPVYRDLQEILKAGERSADLTRQLLAFARKQPMIPVVLDLNNAVSSIFEMLRRLIGEDIELVWIPNPHLWVVRADSSQIDQILTNLLVNARDAIEGMGKVVIATSNFVCDEAHCAQNPGMLPGEYVLLSVSDNGAGMEGETLSHLFEPFFTTKENGKGAGLGLSTVFGIVKQNNGYIKVTSEPGEGTTFSIYIPRVEAEIAPIPAPKAIATTQAAAELILMVEDEGALLDLGKETLEEIGYRVLAAGTPNEALRLAQEHAGEIHLLITDVIMPGMNGKALAEQLRAILPGLKCLFMSGYTADIITDRGVLPEGISFIQKPFPLGDLAAKVREVLDQK